MKRFFLSTLLAGLMLLTSTGCATPAYTAKERDAQIARNWRFEGSQIVDDFDHILLLRPSSRLTIWHLQ